MNHRRVTSLLFVLIAVTFIGQTLAAPSAISRDQVSASSTHGQVAGSAITSILMHRSGCYGTCPVYEVEITKNGAVTFSGHRFVEKTGKHYSKVSPRRFQQLVALVRQLKFFRLNERYRYEQDGCTEWWSDLPTVDIIVTQGSKTKHVSYYYGCKGPAIAKQIVALSEAIDKATGTSKLIGNGGTPPPPPNNSSKRTGGKAPPAA